MNEYVIYNVGCDDETIAKFELTEPEYEFLNTVFETLNKKSLYDCMPRIHIAEAAEYEKGFRNPLPVERIPR